MIRIVKNRVLFIAGTIPRSLELQAQHVNRGYADDARWVSARSCKYVDQRVGWGGGGRYSSAYIETAIV